MTAPGWLVRLLRLDPDGRVAAMAVTVADLRARIDRLHVGLKASNRLVRTIGDARDEARGEAAAAKAAAEMHGRLAQERDDRIDRALRLLADDGLTCQQACGQARLVLAGEEPDEQGGW